MTSHRGLPFQIVAIVAVFAAVGTGLGLGTIAHNGPASASLRDEVGALSERNDRLRADVDWVNRDADVREQFAEDLVPTVLAGRLAAAKVLIVSTPSGLGNVEGVKKMLSVAGAAQTGVLQITAKFTDPRYEDELLDLAHTVLPPPTVDQVAGQSTVANLVPAGADGVAVTSALLASVLIKRAPPASDADRRTVLSSYGSQGYLLGVETVTGPADVVVVVSGPPAVDEDAARRNAAMVSMVTQFDRAGYITVAATDPDGAGNLVAQIRRDPQLKLTISTVDNVATPQGRLVTVWATADQIVGRIGHYGVGEGARLLPTLSP